MQAWRFTAWVNAETREQAEQFLSNAKGLIELDWETEWDD